MTEGYASVMRYERDRGISTAFVTNLQPLVVEQCIGLITVGYRLAQRQAIDNNRRTPVQIVYRRER